MSILNTLKDFLFKEILSPIFLACLRLYFKLHNDIEVKGLEHIKLNNRLIYVANHVSFEDALIMASYLPGKPVFAVNLGMSKRWWMKFTLQFFDCLTLDTRNPMAIKALVRFVESGRPIIIFPEGRLTVTNGLMKVYNGPGMVADKTNAFVVPIRLEGVHFSPFSRLKGINPMNPKQKYYMTVEEPKQVKVDENLRGSKRREIIGEWLYDLMVDMVARTERSNQTLFSAFVQASKTYGKNHIVQNINPVTTDIEGRTYKELGIGTILLGEQFSNYTKLGDYVGLLLPNSNAAVAAFFALQKIGRVPAMLNYSTGPQNIKAAVTAAQINVIVTSRTFLTMGKFEKLLEDLNGVKIIYMEDLAQQFGKMSKISALMRLPDLLTEHNGLNVKPDDPAVVVFTSGSEGVPKGVVLTHRNLLTNMCQLAATIDFSPADLVLNALPMFHSFGLTAGTILPVLNGIPVFLYPNPLNYKVVPELVYDIKATIMFGTDTFLTGYAKKAHRIDFRSTRYIFAGAEKVKDSTRALYWEKFQRAIYEGYGATECSPVISTNCPMNFKSGTVGRFMPLIEWKLEPIPGIDVGGRLYVRGPNIMLGYLRVDNPGVIETLVDGWYDTGDIVSVDEYGFITILGRAKRFAKIGAEMVSLTAVEMYVSKLWSNSSNACMSVKDDRKGEQLVLFTTEPNATRADISAYARENGIGELSVPRTIKVVDSIPLLGSGKTDYTTLQKMADSL